MLQGIPPEYRPWAWTELSGGIKRKGEHMASYYEAMVDMGESSSEFTHQIELVCCPLKACGWPCHQASLKQRWHAVMLALFVEHIQD